MKAVEPFLGRRNLAQPPPMNFTPLAFPPLPFGFLWLLHFDHFCAFNIIQYWVILVDGFLSSFASFEFLWPSSGWCPTAFLTCWTVAPCSSLSFLPTPWTMATFSPESLHPTTHVDFQALPAATPTTYFVFFSSAHQLRQTHYVLHRQRVIMCHRIL